MEENLSSQPVEDETPPLATLPARTPSTNTVWSPDAEMEPPTPHAEPSSQEMATEMEITAPEDKAEAMCSLQNIKLLNLNKY